MKKFKESLPYIGIGLITMLFVTQLVYSFADDEACIELNETLEQQMCKDFNKLFKDVTTIGLVIYICSIVLYFILSCKLDNKQTTQKQTKERLE